MAVYGNDEQSRPHDETRDDGGFLPEPAYTFQAGDRVVLGPEWSLRNRALAPEDVIVSRVISDKLYEIAYTFVKINYGQPNRFANRTEVVRWFDIRPVGNAAATRLLRNTDLNLIWRDAAVADLLEMVYRDGVALLPFGSDDHRWSERQREHLVESVFCHAPIGGFVFMEREAGSQYRYHVLDGARRLDALQSFFENRFACRGVFYNDLTDRERSWFYQYPVGLSCVGNIGREMALRYCGMLNHERLRESSGTA